MTVVSDNNEPPAPELEASTLPAFTVSTPINHTSELYDSGETCHMTLHKGALLNYILITLNPLAWQTSLLSTHLGVATSPYVCLTATNLPTSRSGMCCTPPDIALTLVSIGLIDKASYTVTLRAACVPSATLPVKSSGVSLNGMDCTALTHLEALVLTHSATVEMSATEAHCCLVS